MGGVVNVVIDLIGCCYYGEFGMVFCDMMCGVGFGGIYLLVVFLYRVVVVVCVNLFVEVN